MLLYIPVNSYGHVGTVSSPNHTFFLASLNKWLTSTLCTYFRCGAGACVFSPGVSEPVLLKQPVSSRGSFLHGEVVAIKMALQYLYRYKTQKPSDLRKVHIFSDSQSAVGQLTLGWEAKSHRTTTQEVKSEINGLPDLRVVVELSWLPGHANIKGNELADQQAKEAAQEAKDAEDLQAVSSFGDQCEDGSKRIR